MKPVKLFLCGKCFSEISQVLKLTFIGNSADKQRCDNCGKKYYGSFYMASEKEREND